MKNFMWLMGLVIGMSLISSSASAECTLVYVDATASNVVMKGKLDTCGKSFLSIKQPNRAVLEGDPVTVDQITAFESGPGRYTVLAGVRGLTTPANGAVTLMFSGLVSCPPLYPICPGPGSTFNINATIGNSSYIFDGRGTFAYEGPAPITRLPGRTTAPTRGSLQPRESAASQL